VAAQTQGEGVRSGESRQLAATSDAMVKLKRTKAQLR
jgi:hypothetical protein